MPAGLAGEGEATEPMEKSDASLPPAPPPTEPTEPTPLPTDPAQPQPPEQPPSDPPTEQPADIAQRKPPQYSREGGKGIPDDLLNLDNDVVVEIIDRIGSSTEDEVEYLLQCDNNRQQWVKRKEWLARYPECQPMADIYELCRNNARKKRQIKKETRSRAETRRDDALSPSSSDEGQESSDTFDSPNRRLKRRKRREARREAQKKEAAIREARDVSSTASGDTQEAADLDLPSSSMDLNPRSPPKRPCSDPHSVRRNPPKVVKVDEVAEKHKQILASFVPGKEKSFYTKGQYECAFDMITFSSIIDRKAPERIFNHKIATVIGSPPDHPDFLVIVLQKSCDIVNEMVEAIFPDLTLAISRETLGIYAPKALKQYELTEKLQQQ